MKSRHPDLLVRSWFAIYAMLFFSQYLLADTEKNCASFAAGVSEIADGVYMRQGQDVVSFEGDNVANIGFIVGNRCVAVIDSGGSKEEGEQLKCAIEVASQLPVCYVINTHVHADHVLGNSAFYSPSTQFVGHVNLPTAIILAAPVYAQRASEYEGRKVMPAELISPSLLVQDHLTIDIGGRELFLFAHKRAHTNNDLSILDSKTSTLWLADLLFTKHTPVISGSVNGWIETLAELMGQNAERVVPGHGAMSGDWPESAELLVDYLETMRMVVRKAIADGTPLIEAQENLMVENPWNWTLYNEFRRRNIIGAYTELEWE